jgi:hypothetical protein
MLSWLRRLRLRFTRPADPRERILRTLNRDPVSLQRLRQRARQIDSTRFHA